MMKSENIMLFYPPFLSAGYENYNENVYSIIWTSASEC